MGREAGLVVPRFERGCRCFAVVLDGAIAGYGWLSTGPEWIGELQLEIRPGPGEGYAWNCVTMTAHRRRGVFRSILTGISAAARAGGLRRLWIGSVAIPAERTVGTSGFQPALVFETRHVAGLHLVRTWLGPDARLAADGMNVLGHAAGWRVRPSRSRRH